MCVHADDVYPRLLTLINLLPWSSNVANSILTTVGTLCTMRTLKEWSSSWLWSL